MDVEDLLIGAERELRSRLLMVGADDWSRPTPCEGWSVVDVVEHVIAAEKAVPLMLEGVAIADLGTPQPSARHDYVDDWASASAAANDALLAEGAMDKAVHHERVGEMTGRILAGFRITDRLVHAWDITAALGNDVPPDEELVAVVYEMVAPFADLVRSTGAFAEQVELEPGSNPHDRLLALLGRDPAWRPDNG